jgi:hypothetical protein
MNFVESAAMRAAEAGERSAALGPKSPTSASMTARPQTAPTLQSQSSKSAFGSTGGIHSFNPNAVMTPEQDQKVWSMMQSRLFSQSHLQNRAYDMYSNQSDNPFVLNASTIPKQFNKKRLADKVRTSTTTSTSTAAATTTTTTTTASTKARATAASAAATASAAAAVATAVRSSAPDATAAKSKPAPPKEMSAKRKQWLAQLMEKKRRAKERAEILAKDPNAFDHENTKSKKKKRGGARRKKRGSDDMSASDYESDGPDSAVKFRRTSKSSKVDSSSEMSDTDSPRISSKSWKRRGGGKKDDQDTSDELDDIFDDMHVDGSSSGSSEVGGDYVLDHMNFLEDSHNVRRNQGRHHGGRNGRPSTAPVTSIFESTNLDLSLSRPGHGEGGTLDDSLRFWESTAVSAQQDLSSFVSQFRPTVQVGGRGSARISSVSPVGTAVVDTLFDLNRDDDALERSWMMATDNVSRMEGEDPLAFSIGAVSLGNSLGSSQMGNMMSHRVSPVPLNTSHKMEQSLLGSSILDVSL